jgi:hypothetical protein
MEWHIVLGLAYFCLAIICACIIGMNDRKIYQNGGQAETLLFWFCCLFLLAPFILCISVERRRRQRVKEKTYFTVTSPLLASISIETFV